MFKTISIFTELKYANQFMKNKTRRGSNNNFPYESQLVLCNITGNMKYKWLEMVTNIIDFFIFLAV